MPDSAITFTRVNRSFGGIHAVQDLDLEIAVGSVAVLLGPNGAGKTTSVRLATGALQPDTGTIRILGMDPRIDGNEIRRVSGVVPPKAAFYDRLTGLENLQFAAKLWELGPGAPIESAAERFGIGHALDQEVGGYSTGMRTRLSLARAILHDPTILLLDEPTAGLDPESARAVLDLIRDMAGQGRTIVMCTHLLHEAEGIADQVVLMSEGHAWVAGHPDHLADQYWRDNRVHFDAEDRTDLAILSGLEGVVEASFNGHVTAELDTLDRLPDIVANLVGRGARLTRVEPIQPTLEGLYFEMQRHRRSDREGSSS